MTEVPAEKRNNSPASTQDLVDRDLAEELLQTQNLLQISTIESSHQRVIATFLGQSEFEHVSHAHAALLARLLLECLPAYVHSQGGRIIWSGRMDRNGGLGTVVQRTVTVDGKVHRVLQDGSLFLHLPNERIVVTARRESGMGPEMTLHVCSNRGSAAFFERWGDYARKHNYLRGRAFFADGKIIERRRKYSWDDIYISDDTRGMVCTHVHGFLANYDRLKNLGVKARRGLILAGPPGTGKTLLGKILADTLGVSFLWVLPRHVRDVSSFQTILSIARFVAPAVVFLEDLDLFAEERAANGWTGLGELMNQLDGVIENEGVVTVATTNRLNVIEEALRNRPGRFDRIVEMDAMDEVCRREMLSQELRNAEILPADLDHLVQATEDYTGAQVEELAHTVFLLALVRENGSGSGPIAPPLDGARAEGASGPNVFADRGLLDSALGEMHVERRNRLGFHVA